jgi:F-type H+-transporting ATPase subunit epsilon
MAISCTVVSPERPLFEGDVESLVAPGVEGEIGILPRHAPMIAALGPGVVRLTTHGGVERYAIRGGFLLVKRDVATLLVTDAVKPADLDRATVEAEHQAALEALHHPGSDAEFQELITQRRWCEIRLAILAEPSGLAAKLASKH